MTTAAPLSLHVPEPTVRPGGRPDFSHVGIAEAGEVPRPPIDVSPSEIRNFAYTMIRALDDNGEAVGEWAGSLNADDLRKGLRDMMLTRAFDARMLLSQRQGKTSFYISASAKRRSRPPIAWRSSRATCVFRPTASKDCSSRWAGRSST